MGKSKHPGLLKTAQKDIVHVAKLCDAETKAMKQISSACAELKKLCDTSPSGLSTQVKYMQGIVTNYTRKVQEIVVREQELDRAKGDKRAEADTQKSLDKLEGEADALRAQYNEACVAIQAISEAAKAMVDTVTESSGGLVGITVNGR